MVLLQMSNNSSKSLSNFFFVRALGVEPTLTDLLLVPPCLLPWSIQIVASPSLMELPKPDFFARTRITRVVQGRDLYFVS